MPRAVYYASGHIIPDVNTAIRLQCRQFRFLSLPGEIRNRIYELLFDEFRVLINGNHPQADLKHARRLCQEAFKPRYRLHASFERSLLSQSESERGSSCSWIPIDVLRVCRTVYQEAMPLMYTKTSFRFESMVTLTKFLNVASSHGVQSIKKLELVHSTYGEPLHTDMREWKIRHDRNWKKLCKKVAEEMTALESLKIDLRICDWPTQLDMNAAWAKPLIVLKGRGLDRVDTILRHRSFSEQRLAAAAKKLEMEMMNEEGRRRKQIEQALEAKRTLEAARLKKEELSRKALKSLRITQPTVAAGQGSTSKGKILKPTIKVKLLKGYSVSSSEQMFWRSS